MLKALLKIKYPQAIWGEEICRLVIKHAVDNDIQNIYDLPCGAGFVSYILHSRIKKKYHLIDIDHGKINFAKRLFLDDRVSCRTGDVHNAQFEIKSLWLLVNSLYLLENIDDVLLSQSDKIDYIIGVFPYIHKKNYRFFNANIDTTLNVNEMDRKDTINFFENHGFDLIDSKDTIYFHYLTHSRNKYINLILSPLLYFYEKLFAPNGDIYWIGLFKKKK